MKERLRSFDLQSLIRGLAFAFVGAAAIGAGGALHSIGHTSLILWWSCGVLAGLMIRCGWRSGVPMWIGAVFAQMLLGAPLPAALMPASGMVLGPMLLAAWMARDTAVAPQREFGYRFLLATTGAMLVPPSLTVFAMSVPGGLPPVHSPLARWPEWWAHATLAVLLIAPAVATVSYSQLRAWRRHPRPLLLALAALVALVAAGALLPLPVAQATTMPLAMIAAVLVMMRTDLVFGSLYSLAITMSLILALSPDHPGRFYALVVCGTALLVRLLLDDVQRAGEALREQEALQREDVLDAVLGERRRIGRDMHDTIGQELTSIALLARLVETRARRVAPALGPDALATIRACDRAAASTRDIARSLMAPREGG